MRSLICLIAVLMITAPAMATVEFTASSDGMEVTIGYNCTAAEEVRGIAVLLTSTAGDATVESVDSVATAFNTFIDFAYDDPCSYNVGDGSPLADPDGPGTDDGTLPTSLCMGVLDQSGAQGAGPASTDSLIVLTMGGSDGTITIAADTLRAETGAVGSDLATNLPITVAVTGSCYTGPDVAEWELLLKPDSWCTVDQCHGDADGLTEMFGRTPVKVGWADIDELLAGFQVGGYTNPDDCPWISADFNHASEMFGRTPVRVGWDDIDVLLAYFQVAATAMPADCLTATPVDP